MYYIPYEKEPKKLTPEKLKEIIDSSLRVESGNDKVDIYLPFHFEDISIGKTEEPLRITFKRVFLPKTSSGPLKQQGYSVDDTEYPTYEISDNGRAFEELSRKGGDTNPFVKKAKKLLYQHGMLELKSNHIITVTYSAYSFYRHLSRLNDLLSAVTTVANLDILPPYCTRNHEEEGI